MSSTAVLFLKHVMEHEVSRNLLTSYFLQFLASRCLQAGQNKALEFSSLGATSRPLSYGTKAAVRFALVCKDTKSQERAEATVKTEITKQDKTTISAHPLAPSGDKASQKLSVQSTQAASSVAKAGKHGEMMQAATTVSPPPPPVSGDGKSILKLDLIVAFDVSKWFRFSRNKYDVKIDMRRSQHRALMNIADDHLIDYGSQHLWKPLDVTVDKGSSGKHKSSAKIPQRSKGEPFDAGHGYQATVLMTYKGGVCSCDITLGYST
eukprot:TRINITY_DN6549_c0_g2_i2.p1 TRINITY_DN6549_c0_g2~~TRINITY_DN6549_c0_g2_i2.p1  ORF type:complete len:264 (-),score=24.76 TRINITY_DN6549_c0_g2_i2:165-956(-)